MINHHSWIQAVRRPEYCRAAVSHRTAARPHDLRPKTRGRLVRLAFRALPRLLALSLALSGCAAPGNGPERSAGAVSSSPALRDDLFGEPPEIPEFEQLIALAPEQQNEFLDFFHASKNSSIQPHRRIHVYLERYLDDIGFSDRTLSVAETIRTGQGNCMSLALATAAFARLANVEVGWQIAQSEPVYSSSGSVVYSANHIQTRLYLPVDASNRNLLDLIRPYILIDYFTANLPSIGRKLKENQVIGMVYQNRAVETMAEGDLDTSFWLLKKAMQHDDANPDLFNALAVVHRRAGAPDTAERLYRYTLDRFGDNLLVLRNYHRLLIASGRFSEAEQINERIVALDDPDPFPLLALGDEAAANEQPERALAYYEKARKVAPYLHEVYWKIARIHIGRGDMRSARHAIEKARKNALVDADRQIYQSKLWSLDRLAERN